MAAVATAQRIHKLTVVCPTLVRPADHTLIVLVDIASLGRVLRLSAHRAIIFSTISRRSRRDSLVSREVQCSFNRDVPPSTPIWYDSGYESASRCPPAGIDDCAYHSHPGCAPQENCGGYAAMWPELRGTGDCPASPALPPGRRYRPGAGRDSPAGSGQSRPDPHFRP